MRSGASGASASFFGRRNRKIKNASGMANRSVAKVFTIMSRLVLIVSVMSMDAVRIQYRIIKP